MCRNLAKKALSLLSTPTFSSRPVVVNQQEKNPKPLISTTNRDDQQTCVLPKLPVLKATTHHTRTARKGARLRRSNRFILMYTGTHVQLYSKIWMHKTNYNQKAHPHRDTQACMQKPVPTPRHRRMHACTQIEATALPVSPNQLHTRAFVTRPVTSIHTHS